MRADIFLQTPDKLFFSKHDHQDIRLGDFAKNSSSEAFLAINNLHKKIALLGYPDDEGVRLNGGRPGAQDAPLKIREFLYKMTPPYYFKNENQLEIQDFGNLNANLTLDEKHQKAFEKNLFLLKNKFSVISLGGGHDYGYSDGAAFIQSCLTRQDSQHEKPLIINIDAHLDVRPNDKGNHSGTPFYRLKDEFKNQFELIEIGLQPQCNSSSHWSWAQSNGLHLYSLNEIESSNWQCLWENPLLKHITPSTPVFISFDIDGLKNSEAGGCSQSWPTGLSLNKTLQFLNQVYSKSACNSLGIYEVAPVFDFDNRTSKAAALIAYQFIFQGTLK